MNKENIYMDDETEEKKKFIEAINTYYKLKSQYENNINKEKTQIIKIPGLSWKEKKIEFQKIKHKCINCKRSVGTIFSTKIENEDRYLSALCGDRSNPCSLNININVGIIHDISKLIKEDETEINNYKHTIVKDKNDLLFGYITSEKAVNKYDSIKDAVEQTTKIYEYALEKYLNVIDNPEKKIEIEKKQVEFYNNLDNFNKMINEYSKTKNVQFINDAVNLYVDSMQPKLQEVTKLKYSYSNVEYDENDNTFHFIQKLISHEDIEIDLSVKGQKVLSMKMGDLPIKNNKPKKSIITQAIPTLNESKKKSLTKPKLKFVIEENNIDTDENDEEELERDDENDEEELEREDEINEEKLEKNKKEYKDDDSELEDEYDSD